MKQIIASLALGAMAGLPVSAAIAQEVRDCEVVFLEDFSTNSQRRLRAFIFTDASALSDRLATGVYSAKEIIARTNYHFVDVFLTPNEAPRDRSELNASTAVAWVQYAPDPRKIPFMDQEIKAKVTDAQYSEHLAWESRQDLSESAMELLEIEDPDASCNLILP